MEDHLDYETHDRMYRQEVRTDLAKIEKEVPREGKTKGGQAGGCGRAARGKRHRVDGLDVVDLTLCDDTEGEGDVVEVPQAEKTKITTGTDQIGLSWSIQGQRGKRELRAVFVGTHRP